mmetsp:Transcript_17419/g.37607  ORF Transcript_17419/g.37607 Transcript_17419/m.37607 type:complete len:446 (-) Transcript_17419:283-1620(-)
MYEVSGSFSYQKMKRTQLSWPFLYTLRLTSSPCIGRKIVCIPAYVDHEYLRSQSVNTSENRNGRRPRRLRRDDEVPRPQVKVHRRQRARDDVGVRRLLHVRLDLVPRPSPLLHVSHVSNHPQARELPAHHLQKFRARGAVLRRHDDVLYEGIKFQERLDSIHILLQRGAVELPRSAPGDVMSHALVAPPYRDTDRSHRVEVQRYRRAYPLVDLLPQPLSGTEVIRQRGRHHLYRGVVPHPPRQSRPRVLVPRHAEPQVRVAGVHRADGAVVLGRIFLQHDDVAPAGVRRRHVVNVGERAPRQRLKVALPRLWTVPAPLGHGPQLVVRDEHARSVLLEFIPARQRVEQVRRPRVSPRREATGVPLVLPHGPPHEELGRRGRAVGRVLDEVHLPQESAAVLGRGPPVRRDGLASAAIRISRSGIIAGRRAVGVVIGDRLAARAAAVA